MAETTTRLRTRCPERAKFNTSGHWAKHVASYDDGVMVRRDGDPLLSVCAGCGAPIVRRHSKSAQWFAEPATDV